MLYNEERSWPLILGHWNFQGVRSAFAIPIHVPWTTA